MMAFFYLYPLYSFLIYLVKQAWIGMFCLALSWLWKMEWWNEEREMKKKKDEWIFPFHHFFVTQAQKRNLNSVTPMYADWSLSLLIFFPSWPLRPWKDLYRTNKRIEAVRLDEFWLQCSKKEVSEWPVSKWRRSFKKMTGIHRSRDLPTTSGHGSFLK